MFLGHQTTLFWQLVKHFTLRILNLKAANLASTVAWSNGLQNIRSVDHAFSSSHYDWVFCRMEEEERRRIWTRIRVVDNGDSPRNPREGSFVSIEAFL